MTTSIIVSMYNKREKTLEVIDRLLIPSLLNNSSSEKEFVLIDDASPLEAETRRLVEKYESSIKAHLAISYFPEMNLILASARVIIEESR